MKHRWHAFLFAPSGPLNLGVCRVLFYALLLGWYGLEDYAAWGSVGDVFRMPRRTSPQYVLPVLGPAALSVAHALWLGALTLSCVGLWTRWSTRIAFVLGFYLIGLPCGFGWISHRDQLIVLTAGVMACAHCGDALSVDAWRRRGAGGGPARPSGEYTWPVRLVWVLMALVFFAAGFSKLRCSGLAWIFSDSLARRIVLAPETYPSPWIQSEWCLLLARQPWACRLLAGLTVLLEIGYPLAVWSPRCRWLFVPGMIGVQIGIVFLLGPNFTPFLLCNLFWVPWDRLLGRLAAPFRYAA
jgi:hypothetical protein